MTLGMNGAYVAVAVRILMAITAYAVQAWLGGLAVSALLSSLSYSFAHMRDTISNPYLDTRDFIGFIIFQVISLPMIVSQSIINSLDLRFTASALLTMF